MQKFKSDTILKNFWQNNVRFADLFNTVIFNGKPFINPEELRETDTDVSGMIEAGDASETLSRTRDVVKKCAHGIDFIIMGIENQMTVHYAMPLRTMLYDGLGYLKEYRQMTLDNKREKNYKTHEEFLSGFNKKDKLHPIITLVIYYGERLWDGPLSLKDMVMDMPEEIKDQFCDYRINLLQILDSGKYEFHDPDILAVFDISRRIFNRDYDGIRRSYGDKDIEAEIIRTIGAVTSSQKFMAHAAGKKEVVSMCTALDELEAQCEERGLYKMKKEIIQRMLDKGLDPAKISELTDISIDEIAAIQNDNN